jgi:dihydrofolate reductase
MSKFKLQISMSLDGYVAGPNQGEEHPLGEGGMQLHEWAFALEAWRAPHGHEGGEANASSAVMDEMMENVGAFVMGRNMFGPGRGPWEEHPWDGWWGEEPPYHAPVFVLTHHERGPLEMQGGTTFYFVTAGIESALQRAKEAAGEQDVALGGGASVVQQYLGAGLLDELTITVVPVLLGGGARLLDGVGDAHVSLECTRAINGPAATHLTYRAVKNDANL